MRRRLFNLAVAMSALVLLLTLAVWLRSEFAYDELRRGTSDPVTRRLTQSGICFDRGTFRASHMTFDADGVPDMSGAVEHVRPLRHDSGPRRSGGLQVVWYASRPVVRRIEPPTGTVTNWQLGMPLWPIAIATAVLPLFWLRRQLRLRRLAATNCCPICGYDLRATPDRCPECGSVPETTGTAA